MKNKNSSIVALSLAVARVLKILGNEAVQTAREIERINSVMFGTKYSKNKIRKVQKAARKLSRSTPKSFMDTYNELVRKEIDK